MGTIEARLAELGVALPEPFAPVGSYAPFAQVGALVFVSGQVPIKNGAPVVGRLGADATLAQGWAAARLCALMVIAHLKVACGGDLDRMRRIVKLTGYVNAAPEFGEHPEVINGASDVMVEVFGPAGLHARAAVGCGSLPRGVMVEVEAIAEIALD